jgi:hypothetical protein
MSKKYRIATITAIAGIIAIQEIMSLVAGAIANRPMPTG